MYLNTRTDRALWTAAMERDNAAAYAAILHGAQDLADNPLPEEGAMTLDGLDSWIEGDPGVGLDSEPEDEPEPAECWRCEREFIPSDASGGIDGYDLCPACMRRQSDRENR